jgi:hypothetical protein
VLDADVACEGAECDAEADAVACDGEADVVACDGEADVVGRDADPCAGGVAALGWAAASCVVAAPTRAIETARIGRRRA